MSLSSVCYMAKQNHVSCARRSEKEKQDIRRKFIELFMLIPMEGIETLNKINNANLKTSFSSILTPYVSLLLFTEK